MGTVMPLDERDTDLITVEEAAERFGVTIDRVRNWYRRGKIRQHKRKIDGAVFVRASEILAAFAIEPVDGDEDDAQA